MCVALAALDATVHVRGAYGDRAIPIADFHTAPGEHPEIETVLLAGELIVRVSIPIGANIFAKRSRYVKARDRASYAFALASCAACLDLDGGAIKEVRIALGGVATKPWRAVEAERLLVGKLAGVEPFRMAADLAMAGARTRPDNAFKVELGRRVVMRALMLAAGIS
jgi:xanthine dehydrogenase YagS FAD-binding subunit